MGTSFVPVLITCDFDPTPEVTVENKQRAMEMAIDLFDDLNIRSTLFITARHADKYLTPGLVRQFGKKHEIACHGLTHAYDEEWNRMPLDETRSRVKEATKLLEDIAGRSIESFRGPRVKTSCMTQQALEENMYRADSSVCSQRVDVVSSNLINPNWIFAPRLPYHPHEKNPFRRGNRKLWSIPVSAMVLPFVSGSIYTLGLNTTKSLFQALYQEAAKTGKPIVYLMHPVEFVPFTLENKKPKNPGFILIEGLQFRYRFYERDVSVRYAKNRELFEFMKSFPRIKFMNLRDYVTYLESGEFVA